MIISLYTLLGLLTIVFLLTSYRLFRTSRAQTIQITALQQQLSALCSAAVGSDERVVRFEQTLAALRENQNTLSSGHVAHQRYEHAIRLARKGVDSEQLRDNCNLSDEEALLIARLHGAQKAPATGWH